MNPKDKSIFDLGPKERFKMIKVSKKQQNYLPLG